MKKKKLQCLKVKLKQTKNSNKRIKTTKALITIKDDQKATLQKNTSIKRRH